MALGFLICLWILQQFSGNFAIIFYAVDIFDGINDMKDNMMDHMESMSNVSYLSAISVGAIRIVGSVLGLHNFPFVLSIFKFFKATLKFLHTIVVFDIFWNAE